MLCHKRSNRQEKENYLNPFMNQLLSFLRLNRNFPKLLIQENKE